MLDARTASFASGKIRGFSGTRPTDADAALSSNTQLFECTFGATAFGSASAGVLTANAITSDSSADATGTLSFIRCYQSNGTTALDDLSVGVGSGEAQFATLSIVASAVVSISSFTITAPVGT
jgi:hypothetical protein